MKWIPEAEYERFVQLDPDLILTAYLIQERIKGPKSKWYSWIQVGLFLFCSFQVLPSHPLTVASFSNQEINEFEDPAMIPLFHRQQKDYFRSYYSFSHHMCPYFLTVDGSWKDRIWGCSYSGFIWGYTMAITRSVTKHKLLIPLMDFRNFISTDSVSMN